MDFSLKADRDAEKIIIGILKKKFPEYAVLAEESGKSGDSDYLWIIDPLDGTHNYAFGVPIFGTVIALQHKNEVVIGVIFLPFLNELYYAEKGRGAFMNGKRISIGTKGRFVSFGGTHRFTDKIVSKSMVKIAENYHPRLRFIGSAAFSSAYVSIGRIAAYVVFFSNPWDIAAGALLVEEAGGRVTNINGKKWNPYQKHYILSNSKMHKEILRTIT